MEHLPGIILLALGASNDNNFPMQDNWHIYEQMRDSGISPHDVYKQGQLRGLDLLSLIRMLRSVFSLDLQQAKEITVQADGAASSLAEYQELLLPALLKALEGMEDETVK